MFPWQGGFIMLEKDKIGQDLLFLKENIPEGYNVIKEMIKIKKEYKKKRAI